MTDVNAVLFKFIMIIPAYLDLLFIFRDSLSTMSNTFFTWYIFDESNLIHNLGPVFVTNESNIPRFIVLHVSHFKIFIKWRFFKSPSISPCEIRFYFHQNRLTRYSPSVSIALYPAWFAVFFYRVCQEAHHVLSGILITVYIFEQLRSTRRIRDGT